MELNHYQRRAAETAVYPRKGGALTYVTLGLVGEAGEIANKVKKIARDEQGVVSLERAAQIAEELGDVLWYAAMAAEELGTTLESVARLNLAKLESRAARGVLGGDGDQR